MRGFVEKTREIIFVDTFYLIKSNRWNKMKACVFFGHRDDNYCRYKERIVEILIDLIENSGVTQFYSGG